MGRDLTLTFIDVVKMFVQLGEVGNVRILYYARCIGLKWPTSQMADGILKFVISHLGLGSNVQLDLVIGH